MAAERAVILRRKLSALQRQKALKNTDQMGAERKNIDNTIFPNVGASLLAKAACQPKGFHGCTHSPVGAMLARDARPATAFILAERVIVDDHREQARSYKGSGASVKSGRQ